MSMMMAALMATMSPTALPVTTPDWSNQTSEYRKSRRTYRERRLRSNERIWQGEDGRYRCKRDNGTTGLVIGAVVGGVAGHEIAGRGDRTLGTVIGGAVGAIAGREIDRSNARCR